MCKGVCGGWWVLACVSVNGSNIISWDIAQSCDEVAVVVAMSGHQLY